MRVVNGKLIIQLEWPNNNKYTHVITPIRDSLSQVDSDLSVYLN